MSTDNPTFSGYADRKFLCKNCSYIMFCRHTRQRSSGNSVWYLKPPTIVESLMFCLCPF